MSLNVYIGYDAKESVAYHVLCHSLLRRATGPISITPLVRDHLPYFTRKRGPLESTDFSFTRFLVPYLSGYEGFSLFMDCDMLAQVPIQDIWHDTVHDARISVMGRKQIPVNTAVWVCKHDYVPKDQVKMSGAVQTAYARKNWSSVMLFDNAECRVLTPDYVNEATGLHLHRFEWLADDQIESLPLEWNWLVGEYGPCVKPQLLHYTLGGPWLHNYQKGPYVQEWFAEYRDMTGRDFWPTKVCDRPPLASRG